MTRQRKIDIIVISGIVIILACMLLPGTRVSTVESRICPKCGAREYQTFWWLGCLSLIFVGAGPLALDAIVRRRADSSRK